MTSAMTPLPNQATLWGTEGQGFFVSLQGDRIPPKFQVFPLVMLPGQTWSGLWFLEGQMGTESRGGRGQGDLQVRSGKGSVPAVVT